MFNHFLQNFFVSLFFRMDELGFYVPSTVFQSFRDDLFFRICMCQWRFQTIRQTPSILIIFRRGSMRLMSYHHLIIVKYSRIRFKKFPMFNTNTIKIGKIWTLEKNCNNSKIWTMWFFYAVMWAATWMAVHPAKTQISLDIRPVWSESLLYAWRNRGTLTTHWAHSEDSDQTGWPSLI